MRKAVKISLYLEMLTISLSEYYQSLQFYNKYNFNSLEAFRPLLSVGCFSLSSTLIVWLRQWSRCFNWINTKTFPVNFFHVPQCCYSRFCKLFLKSFLKLFSLLTRCNCAGISFPKLMQLLTSCYSVLTIAFMNRSMV